MLGAGHILVQRYGDILDGKRTWQKELSFSNVVPTLPDAVAGDARLRRLRALRPLASRPILQAEAEAAQGAQRESDRQ